MGTLFNQRPRQDRIDGYIGTVIAVARDIWPNVEEHTPEQIEAACKVFEAALKMQNADVLDEQLTGFAELIQQIINAWDY
jgi:hypothetical protein